MKIIVTHPFSDGSNRVWIKGRRYEVPDETGAQFIKIGYARSAYADLVAELAEAGSGLLVSADTDPHLVAEAKAAKLPTHTQRAKAKPKAKPKPEPKPEPDAAAAE